MCVGDLVGCEGFPACREVTLSPSSVCVGDMVGCEGFPTFRELTLSPSSVCTGGLVECEGFPTFREPALFPSSECAGGLVIPNKQHTLKTGTKLVPETLENLCNLTRLSARESCTEFCRRENLKN